MVVSSQYMNQWSSIASGMWPNFTIRMASLGIVTSNGITIWLSGIGSVFHESFVAIFFFSGVGFSPLNRLAELPAPIVHILSAFASDATVDAKTSTKSFGRITFSRSMASLNKGAISLGVNAAMPQPIRVTRYLYS